MDITKDYINSVGANADAVKNGADLVRKKNFKNLSIDKDKTFISGECMGSGKNPYVCSADFINESSPVFRCSCPSRQIPCKHVLGLMLSYADGHSFAAADVPEDILAKRETKEKRIEKAKEKLEVAEKADSEPKEKSAAWKKSAIKKIDSQLLGIEEAEKILLSFAQAGFGSLDAKSLASYVSIVKQLDSYFIPGIQNEINDLLGLAKNVGDKKADEKSDYMFLSEKLCRIYFLLTKSREYLEAKKSSPDKPDTTSEIEELLGYAWKLEELAGFGLFEADANLVQLCFHVRCEEDKKQYVDEGFYISLNSGKIYKTRNYRPFKAAKHIREEDSIFRVLGIPRLYIYPSASANPRVRWEEASANMSQPLSPEICAHIKSFSAADYSEVTKGVKNQLKNLLLFPHPAVLVNFANIKKAEGGKYAIYDKAGNAICLKKSAYVSDSFVFLFERLTEAEAKNNSMLLLFENDIESGELFAQPLALVTDEKILRLVY